MGSHSRPDWTPQEIARLRELCDSGQHTFPEIATLLGRPLHGVMYKTYERGFGNRYRHVEFLYEHDRTFFSRITPETCYWAGVMTTDGSVMYKGNASILNLTVAIKDLDHLERWKAAIKATHPIKRGWNQCTLSTRDPEAMHEHCYLRLDSAPELVADLSRVFNITAGKTLRCPPPNLPDVLHRLCYIRGFIDGDGIVTSTDSQIGFMEVKVCGCNREMIANIKDIVDALDIPHISDAKRPSLLYQGDGESCYYWGLRGFRAAVLFDLLRRTPTPNLARKWDNPRVIRHVDHWRAQTDRWPPEAWFAARLTPSLTTCCAPAAA